VLITRVFVKNYPLQLHNSNINFALRMQKGALRSFLIFYLKSGFARPVEVGTKHNTRKWYGQFRKPRSSNLRGFFFIVITKVSHNELKRVTISA
jgi:hypothetical protein